MVVLIALGVLAGVPVAVLAVAAVSWAHPAAAALVAAVVVARARRRRRTAPGAAARLVTVAAELRSGTAIRDALAGAVDDPGLARMLRRGRPWADLSDGIRSGFGEHGPAVVAAVGVVARTGGSAAPVFGELAAEAIAEAELAGERRAAAAPVLAQGAVVGGVPLAVLVHGTVSGRLADVAARGSIEAGIVVFGTLATMVGALVVAAILWREFRR